MVGKCLGKHLCHVLRPFWNTVRGEAWKAPGPVSVCSQNSPHFAVVLGHHLLSAMGPSENLEMLGPTLRVQLLFVIEGAAGRVPAARFPVSLHPK